MKTLHELVSAVGGGRYVSGLLGVSESAVSRWCCGLAIPKKYRYAIAVLLRKSQKEVIESQIHFLRKSKESL